LFEVNESKEGMKSPKEDGLRDAQPLLPPSGGLRGALKKKKIWKTVEIA
jgi:hypothetical protein